MKNSRVNACGCAPMLAPFPITIRSMKINGLFATITNIVLNCEGNMEQRTSRLFAGAKLTKREQRRKTC